MSSNARNTPAQEEKDSDCDAQFSFVAPTAELPSEARQHPKHSANAERIAAAVNENAVASKNGVLSSGINRNGRSNPSLRTAVSSGTVVSKERPINVRIRLRERQPLFLMGSTSSSSWPERENCEDQEDFEERIRRRTERRRLKKGRKRRERTHEPQGEAVSKRHRRGGHSDLSGASTSSKPLFSDEDLDTENKKKVVEKNTGPLGAPELIEKAPVCLTSNGAIGLTVVGMLAKEKESVARKSVRGYAKSASPGPSLGEQAQGEELNASDEERMPENVPGKQKIHAQSGSGITDSSSSKSIEDVLGPANIHGKELAEQDVSEADVETSADGRTAPVDSVREGKEAHSAEDGTIARRERSEARSAQIEDVDEKLLSTDDEEEHLEDEEVDQTRVDAESLGDEDLPGRSVDAREGEGEDELDEEGEEQEGCDEEQESDGKDLPEVVVGATGSEDDSDVEMAVDSGDDVSSDSSSSVTEVPPSGRAPKAQSPKTEQDPPAALKLPNGPVAAAANANGPFQPKVANGEEIEANCGEDTEKPPGQDESMSDKSVSSLSSSESQSSSSQDSSSSASSFASAPPAAPSQAVTDPSWYERKRLELEFLRFDEEQLERKRKRVAEDRRIQLEERRLRLDRMRFKAAARERKAFLKCVEGLTKAIRVISGADEKKGGC